MVYLARNHFHGHNRRERVYRSEAGSMSMFEPYASEPRHRVVHVRDHIHRNSSSCLAVLGLSPKVQRATNHKRSLRVSSVSLGVAYLSTRVQGWLSGVCPVLLLLVRRHLRRNLRIPRRSGTMLTPNPSYMDSGLGSFA